MEDTKITEEEIEALYSFLSLEWEEMGEEARQSWEKMLIELENKIEKQNEKNYDLRT